MSDVRAKSNGDWTFLGLALAKRGIPSEEDFCDTDDYEVDPWRPMPNCEGVRITLDWQGAEKLYRILEESDV